MVQSIYLGAFGNPVGALPTEGMGGFPSLSTLVKTTGDAARSIGAQQATDMYRNASKFKNDAGRLIQKQVTDLSKRGVQTVSKLSVQVAPILKTARTAVQQQATDFAAEMGSAAAQGAQEEVMDTVKRWAPWAVGGIAVAGLGIWLLRR